MLNDKAPVKIAVIGAGLIGHRHIQHVIEEPYCELTEVVTRTLERKDFISKTGAKHYTDIDEFLKETTAEAAIIATPNNTHASIGMKCAEAGLHLLVEKPIDSDINEAEKLVKVAERAGVKLLVGHHRRHNPFVTEAKQIIDSGKLGTLVAVNALWTLLKPLSYFNVSWRREPGGGVVLINLIHCLDLMRFFFGDLELIHAECSNKVRGFPVEETVVILLKFKNGVLGSMVISDTVASPYNFESATGENPLVYAAFEDCYRIFGTHGTLDFPKMVVWHYRGEGEQGWGDPISSERYGVRRSPPLVNQLRHFCEMIRNDVPSRCPGEEAIKSLQAINAVIQAMNTGKAVKL